MGTFRQIWSVVRLFLTKFGREAFAIAKEVVTVVAGNPAFMDWSDQQRREYVVAQLTARLSARYGSIPGFTWVINFAVEMAVGWLRQQMKGARA
jgi:hypothetical protein